MALTFVLCATLALSPNVHVIRGEFVPGQQPDGNSVIFMQRDGLVVFDTGRHVAYTQQIIDFAREAKKPITTIVNSHWHLDHTGGNVLLRREFPNARVYASPAIHDALKGFLANYRKQLEEMLAKKDNEAFRTEIALIDAGDKLAPDVDVSAPLKLGGLRVEIEKNAATAGDLWIFDPKSGVLAAGDLVTLPAPFLDTACPAGWQASLDRLAKVKFKTLIPGHGAPMTRRDFETYRTAFNRLIACKGENKPCIDGWFHDLGTLAEDTEFNRGMMGYYVDLLQSGRLCRG